MQSAPRDLRALLFILVLPLLLVGSAITLGELVDLNTDWYSQNVIPLPFLALPADNRMAAQGTSYALLASTFYAQDPTKITEIPSSISVHDYLFEYPAFIMHLWIFFFFLLYPSWSSLIFDEARHPKFGAAISNDGAPYVFNNTAPLNFTIWFNKNFGHTAPIALHIVHDILAMKKKKNTKDK